MYVESVSIENYKCFLNRQSFRFESGFNLLVGANNSGKTTVLDVLDMDPGLNEPHRSKTTIPEFGGQPNQLSEFEVVLATRLNELRMLVGGSQIFLPVPTPDGGNLSAEFLSRVGAYASDDGNLRLRVAFGHATDAVTFEGGDVVAGRASRHTPNEPLWGVVLTYSAPNAAPQIGVTSGAGIHQPAGSYYMPLRQRIYRFNAQRRPGTDCVAMGTTQLDRDAVALPYCINHLSTYDPHVHQQLCGLVRRIFPNIHWVQAPPMGGNFQLQCVAHTPQEGRRDLATPLSRMGTGIGNVIAMLYVVLTSRDPQVIAIDEPNAFLHPRALRELLAILDTEGKRHQFLLTAHSADVLTAVKARTISLLEFGGTATRVKGVGPRDLHQLRAGLADLGVRMTDLHARDRVLWVEGQTEELVLPELLRFACREVAAGTAVLRVERTGTFSKKSIEPEEVMRIYERLSVSSALVPPMVAILLDAETRTPEQCRVIERESGGKLRFLDRPMLENFLLDAEAISAVLVDLGEPTTPKAVQGAFPVLMNLANPEHHAFSGSGAELLGQIFSQLSESRLEFRKTRDVPALVEWLLENHPDRLDPLRVFLRNVFALPT